MLLSFKFGIKIFLRIDHFLIFQYTFDCGHSKAIYKSKNRTDVCTCCHIECICRQRMAAMRWLLVVLSLVVAVDSVDICTECECRESGLYPGEKDDILCANKDTWLYLINRDESLPNTTRSL